MIEKYQLKKINKEEIILLYLNFNYEFSSEPIINKVNDFIERNHIKWNGYRVILIVDNIILGSLILKKENKKSKKFDYISTLVLNHFDEDYNEISYSKITFKNPKLSTKNE